MVSYFSSCAKFSRTRSIQWCRALVFVAGGSTRTRPTPWCATANSCAPLQGTANTSTMKTSKMIAFFLDVHEDYWLLINVILFHHCFMGSFKIIFGSPFYADCHSGRGILFYPCPKKPVIIRNLFFRVLMS